MAARASAGLGTSDHHYPSPETLKYSRWILRDIIGFADGLTVPFALTAGLSSLGSAKLVVIGDLTELLSGAISMGMGSYLATLTDRDRYLSWEKLVKEDLVRNPVSMPMKIIEGFANYGISTVASQIVADCLSEGDNLVKFIMEFKLGCRKPDPSRAWLSAIAMGLSYFVGGLLPMIPYFATTHVTHALFISIGITAVILLVFGFIKNFITVKTQRSGLHGALQTLGVGVIAAGASYGVVYGIDHSNLQ